MSAGRALGLDQVGLIEGAQECVGGVEHVRGPPDGIGGVVLVVEVVGAGMSWVGAQCTSMSMGPDASRSTGAHRVGFQYHQPAVAGPSCPLDLPRAEIAGIA